MMGNGGLGLGLDLREEKERERDFWALRDPGRKKRKK